MRLWKHAVHLVGAVVVVMGMGCDTWTSVGVNMPLKEPVNVEAVEAAVREDARLHVDSATTIPSRGASSLYKGTVVDPAYRQIYFTRAENGTWGGTLEIANPGTAEGYLRVDVGWFNHRPTDREIELGRDLVREVSEDVERRVPGVPTIPPPVGPK